jgi:hypothetical protein
VSRPWNKVYSEIRSHIDPHSAVQVHVLQHVERHVELHPVEQDGKVGSIGHGGFIELRNGELYVHPPTGLLRRYVQRRHYKPPLPTTHVLIDATHEYRKHNGVWYWAELVPIDQTDWWSQRATFADAFVGVRTAHQLYERYHQHLYATGKRQLNKRAIREMKRRYAVVE